jgi:small-conductance mechanosensitive channel
MSPEPLLASCSALITLLTLLTQRAPTASRPAFGSPRAPRLATAALLALALAAPHLALAEPSAQASAAASHPAAPPAPSSSPALAAPPSAIPAPAASPPAAVSPPPGAVPRGSPPPPSAPTPAPTSPSTAAVTFAQPPPGRGVDLSTPRKAVDALLRFAHGHDYTHAAACLDLRALPYGSRNTEGPTLARDLVSVLDRKLWLDLSKISDDVEGEPSDGANWELLGTIALGDAAIPTPIALTRSYEGGSHVWQISKVTVAAIPALSEKFGDQWLEPYLPQALVRAKLLTVSAWQWMAIAASLSLSIALGRALARIVGGGLERLARTTSASWDDTLARTARGPLRPILSLGVAYLLIHPLRLSVPAQSVVDHLTITLLVFAAARLASRLIAASADMLEGRLPEDTAGELQSRGIRTQLQVARRLSSILIGVVACSLVLIQFEVVRSVGVSLLASAGLLGVLFGVAAQKSLAGVIAGIQVSMSQPIRLGDIVVVEGEYGTIEEINLTYVIVKIWDERRLVMPIGRFLDAPFQNWTKMGLPLTGTVFVHVDPAAPVPLLRAEVARLCQTHKAWDGRKCSLLVTDSSERTITVRASVSAANADALWDLRCAVREGLIAFLNDLDGGAYLPRLRMIAPTPLSPEQPRPSGRSAPPAPPPPDPIAASEAAGPGPAAPGAPSPEPASPDRTPPS